MHTNKLNDTSLYTPEIVDFILGVTRTVCLEYRVLPTQLFGGRRSGDIPAARLAVTELLQQRLGSIQEGKKRRWMLLPDPVSRNGSRPHKWQPISTTLMGRILGVDHSALCHARSKRAKERRLTGIEAQQYDTEHHGKE